MSQRPKFRCIRPGTGGTLKFGKSSTNLVGVADCETSIGIYFQIDAERSFCANIQVLSNGGQAAKISQEQGKALTEQIVSKLIRRAAKEKWDLDTQTFANGLLAVCRQTVSTSSNGDQRKLAAWFVVDALRYFVREAISRVYTHQGMFGPREKEWQKGGLVSLYKSEEDKAKEQSSSNEAEPTVELVVASKKKSEAASEYDSVQWYVDPKTMTAQPMKVTSTSKVPLPNVEFPSASETPKVIPHTYVGLDAPGSERRKRVEWMTCKVGLFEATTDCNGFVIDHTGNTDRSYFGRIDGNQSANLFVAESEDLAKGEWVFEV